MVKTIEVEDAAQENQTAKAWFRLARYAALTVGLWSLLLQLFAGELIPPVAVIGLVFVVLSTLLSGNRRWLGLLAAGLALLSFLGNLQFAVDDLTHPSSPVTFVLGALVAIATLVIVVSGIAGFRSASTELVRPVGFGSLAVFGVFVVVGVVSSAAVDSDAPLADDVQVVASGVEYDISELTVSTGVFGLWLDNQDGIRHTVTVEGSDFELDVPALSSSRTDFDLEPGVYNVFCAVPGHERMTIELTVEG